MFLVFVGVAAVTVITGVEMSQYSVAGGGVVVDVMVICTGAD